MTSALDWGWVVSTTPRPLYPQQRPGIHCIGGWVGPRAGLNGYGKSASTWIRSPDRPARSESLYRLSYRSPCLLSVVWYKFTNISEEYITVVFRVQALYVQGCDVVIPGVDYQLSGEPVASVFRVKSHYFPGCEVVYFGGS